MRIVFSHKFNEEMAVVHPGEYYVSDKHIIHTLLGTCVSVVLYCERLKIGGLNHYMLPTNSSVQNNPQEPSGRYGEYAMDLLINQFVKRGISRNELTAKVFGGGKVLDVHNMGNRPHVGTQNVEFVLDYLHKENIPIVSQDMGGEGGRKIYFFPWTGKVLVSRIRNTRDIAVEEDKYEDKLDHIPHKVVLFDQEETR